MIKTPGDCNLALSPVVERYLLRCAELMRLRRHGHTMLSHESKFKHEPEKSSNEMPLYLSHRYSYIMTQKNVSFPRLPPFVAAARNLTNVIST